MDERVHRVILPKIPQTIQELVGLARAPVALLVVHVVKAAKSDRGGSGHIVPVSPATPEVMVKRSAARDIVGPLKRGPRV